MSLPTALITTPQTWTGNIWQFTVDAECVNEDNFEDYADDTALGNVWTDGYNAEDSGALIYLGTGDVDANRHTGEQGMIFDYNNTGSVEYGGYTYPAPYFSEANRAPANANYTRDGAEILSLWFKGDAGNAAEQLYVKLDDGSSTDVEVYSEFDDVNGVFSGTPDADAVKDSNWQEWNIKLANYSVTLSSIDKLIIGLGKQTPVVGGGGRVIFDDIRICPPRCLLTEPTYRPPGYGDINEDCKYDFLDFVYFSKNWLKNGLWP